jgi:hypothetical protein
MAKPRVFVSSTYYDLKYVRSSLELFIESIGYDAVLSEQGDVPYAPDKALDESCYREVQNCDLYVLIIGGRYGSEASETKTERPRNVFDRYESITKMEYKAAIEKDIPIYILIERAVYAEYQTYLKNRDNQGVKYAHVDSINVFRFIEEILTLSQNPIQAFDKYAEIEEWLRIQWAGLFRDLVQRLSSQQQIASLAAQIAELAEVNKTLRRYLEEVIGTVASPQDSKRIINNEAERLAEAQVLAKLETNDLVDYLTKRYQLPIHVIREATEKATNPEEWVRLLREHPETPDAAKAELPAEPPRLTSPAFKDLNRARELIGRAKFPIPAEDTPVVPTKSTATASKKVKKS